MMNWLIHTGSAALPPLARGLAAFFTAAFAALLAGRPVIRVLRRHEVGERTEETPIEDEELRERITAKSGTPTMGGLIIALGLLAGCLLWGDPASAQLLVAIGAFSALATLGAVDDWMKLTGRGGGMKVRYKLLVQGIVGAGLGTCLFLAQPERWGLLTELLPWLPAGLAAAAVLLWWSIMVATMSNAVNVTDGLDGLAGGLTLVAVFPLAWTIIRSGTQFPAGSGEILVFAGALSGAVIGFLWHNWHPARVFMGDTGSLALGGSIAVMALLVGRELALPLIGLVFLLEFGSSVLQVLWFKVTGRRILPIAPLHHIWQQRGVPETHIVFRFCVVGLIVALASTPLL